MERADRILWDYHDPDKWEKYIKKIKQTGVQIRNSQQSMCCAFANETVQHMKIITHCDWVKFILECTVSLRSKIN